MIQPEQNVPAILMIPASAWLAPAGRARLALAVLALAAACGRADPPADDSARSMSAAAPAAARGDTMRQITMSAAEVEHGGIRWSVAEARDAAGVIEAPGQLLPNEDRTARIGAPLQARVLAVHVQAGARVGRGQALVTLQSPEASTARAERSWEDVCSNAG